MHCFTSDEEIERIGRGLRIGGQPVEPFEFDLPPCGAQRPAVDRDQHGHVALRGLHNLAHHVMALVAAVQVESFRLVRRLLRKMIRHGTPNQRGRIRTRRGLRLTAAHRARKEERQPEPATGRLSY